MIENQYIEYIRLVDVKNTSMLGFWSLSRKQSIFCLDEQAKTGEAPSGRDAWDGNRATKPGCVIPCKRKSDGRLPKGQVCRSDFIIFHKYIILSILFFGACVSPRKYEQELKLKQEWQDRAIALANDLRKAEQHIGSMLGVIATQNERINLLRVDSTLAKSMNMDHESAKLPSQPEPIILKDPHAEKLIRAIIIRDSLLKDLKKKFDKVLRRYSESELTSEIINGRLKLTFSDELLYKTGSIRLNEKGVQALAIFASVAKAEPDIVMVIEGHTDNVPIRRNNIRDNWDLSVLRASSIARVLRRDFKINPRQLVACGRGEYLPRASNNTEAGQAKNRRTEIIILPCSATLNILGSNHFDVY